MIVIYYYDILHTSFIYLGGAKCCILKLLSKHEGSRDNYRQEDRVANLANAKGGTFGGLQWCNCSRSHNDIGTGCGSIYVKNNPHAIICVGTTLSA